MIYFLFGLFAGTFLLEPFIINFIYMKNPALFNDIILTEKSSKKLRRYYERRYYEKNS